MISSGQRHTPRAVALRAHGSRQAELRVLAAAVLVFMITLLLLGRTAAAQTNAPAEEFSSFAINMGALTSGSTANVILTINRWSTDAERQRLLAVLKEKGQQAMLEALQDQKRAGTIRTPSSVGYDLQFAWQEPTEKGGRRILIATDRPIGFAEAQNRGRTMDYPLTVIEFHMPPEGTGQGTMSVAAKMIPAGRTVLVENYDTQPVRLNNIQARTLDR